MDKLPDKGDKIKSFIDQLKTELNQREKLGQTSNLFKKLSVVDKDMDTSNESKALQEIVNLRGSKQVSA